MDTTGFLPISQKELKARNIEQPDFIYIIGDAYVDHPSFGPAVIGRVLESHGFTVAIISQPDWKNTESIMKFGTPKLAFLVSAGNMDSMVNHYFVSKKKRPTDAYTPGGEIGKRPDRAVTVYCNMIRQIYKTIPIIVGGIEASLRRMAHYDYWSDSFRRSILLESGADLVSYGMGEKSIVEIAEALNSGISVRDLTFIKGTVYKAKSLEQIYDFILLPHFELMKHNPIMYAESFLQQNENTDPFTAKILVEPYSEHCFIVQNPPQEPLTQEEMDDVYSLPYMRAVHPSYDQIGKVAAIEEIKFSLTSCRGCFGACNFCALTFHQGRIVQTRSHESLLNEAKMITEMPDFKGYIHDVGGPTANFRHPACDKQLKNGACVKKQCLFPTPCANLDADHSDYVELLRKLRTLKKVKKVFVRSGIRFDYCIADSNKTFLRELVNYHVSGQLKVAPEHVSKEVLKRMGKPSHEVYERFVKAYEKENKESGKNQFLVPYFMSSHPGSTLKDAVELAEYIKKTGYMPEQVQDFYPTPSTISTVMYYTGIDPRTREKIYVPKNPHEKALQRALIQYQNPDNYDLVKEALELAGRKDLIGFEEKCLIRPRKLAKEKNVKIASKMEKKSYPAKKTEKKANPTKKTDGKAIPTKKREKKYVQKKQR